MGTSNRIPYSDVAAHVPSSPSQVQVNHDNCSAGADTKRRLYVRLKETGAVVWYCHHCSGRGAFTPTTNRRRLRVHKPLCDMGAEQRSAIYERTAPYIRGSFEESARGVTQKAREFFRGLDPADLTAYGIGQCKSDKSEVYNERVCLPCYGSGGLVAVQYRRISDDDPRKYITLGTGYFDTHYLRTGHRSYENTTLVIVEDILSAIRVGKTHRCIALLNSRRDLSEILQVVSEHDRVVVWLDNDNAKVKYNARRMTRELELHCPNVLLVTKYDDPKHQTDERIMEVIDGH